MKIAYSKLGRSWNLDPRRASTVGGDLDVIRLLMRLAWDHPEHEFILVGRNSGEDPQRLGYPENVVNPWTRWTAPTLSYDEIKRDGKRYVDGIVEHFREQSRDLADEIEGHVMWLGQHGGSNSPLPQIGGDWATGPFTTPQMSFVNYCAYLLDFCWRSDVEPVLLCPDPRNYLKARETPPITGPVLAQYDMLKQTKFEQFDRWDHRGYDNGERIVQVPLWTPHLPGRREQSVWVGDLPYEYAAIEMTALDEPGLIRGADSPGEVPFGIITNENRKEVGRLARLPLMQTWVLPRYPDCPIYGKWSDESIRELGRERIDSVDTSQMYPTLRSFRCTLTLPASGSGWATAKPWEAFAAGTVMFFHPNYDDQGHILPIRGQPHWSDDTPVSEDARLLSQFLRVQSPSQFWSRSDAIIQDDAMWREFVTRQRRYFEFAFKHWRGGAAAVEDALGV